ERIRPHVRSVQSSCASSFPRKRRNGKCCGRWSFGLPVRSRSDRAGRTRSRHKALVGAGQELHFEASRFKTPTTREGRQRSEKTFRHSHNLLESVSASKQKGPGSPPGDPGPTLLPA